MKKVARESARKSVARAPASGKTSRFTREETEAMKARALELKAEARANKNRAEGEKAALAAIAAAVAPESPAPTAPATYGDVTVRPVAQKPTLFPDKEVTRAESQEPPPAENFIPPAAERPAARGPHRHQGGLADRP